MDYGQGRISFAGPINRYAAAAVSLIVTILSIAFTFLSIVISQQLDYSVTGIIFMTGFLVVATIYLVLPILLNGKYGWKTILTTYLLQSVLLFFASLLLVAIFGATKDNSPYEGAVPVNQGLKTTQ